MHRSLLRPAPAGLPPPLKLRRDKTAGQERLTTRNWRPNRERIWSNMASVSKKLPTVFGDPRSLAIPDPVQSQLEERCVFN
jgi:hypothetical protein